MTQKELKDILHYCPIDGNFRWTKNITSRARKGQIAGCKNSKGYIQITINKKSYLAHRLVWLYRYGIIPNQIDHVNHNKSDNRIDNIREVSSSENGKNLPKPKHNTSGFVGVSWIKSRKRWRSHIMIDGKTKILGEFKDIYNAIAKRAIANEKYGFHLNHGV